MKCLIMSKNNIIVTGGLGFIGFNLVKKLIEKKFFVIIIDKITYAANKKNLQYLNKKNYKFYNFDIINKKKLIKTIVKYKPNCIFNLAAETHVDQSINFPKKFITTNIYGVFNILEALKEIKDKYRTITKLIQVSTDEVYGDIKRKKFSKESDRYFPSSPYSSSKASGDLIIFSYIRTFKIPAIVTNCCNNFGPGQNKEKLIPKIISCLKKNKNLPIYGKGKNQREWIFVEDHCEALLKIMNKGKLGEQYNIGSGNVYDNIFIAKSILNLYKKKFNNKCKSKIIFVKDRPGHDFRYALNSNKIKKKLGWKSKFSFAQGIYKTLINESK